MYGTALALSAATTAGTVGLPFFQLGSIGPIQSFGLIVAAGVLIGASYLRRYAEWHGVEDLHIRQLLGWVTISGFIGAHLFDMVAYNYNVPWGVRAEAPPSWWFLPRALWVQNWPMPFRLWEGISSYGGFLGGAMGFYCFLWRNRLPTRLFSDLTIVGLLIAFSIGRIACTVVSDHIGALVPPDAWYAPLAMEYPTNLNLDAIQYLLAQHPEVAGQPTLLAWNLGFIELLYLIPVNALILFLAFRSSKRMPAGFITALTGVLYAPVRFFLDYLRPPNSDPRHFGFTFAQWASILAFGAAVYLAMRILRNGKPAETFGTTSGEVQAKRRMELKEDAEVVAKAASTKKGSSPSAKGASVAKQAGSAKASGMTKEVSQTPQTPDERKAALLAQIKREKPPAGDVKDETAAVKSTSKALADDKPQTPKTENTASGSEKSSSNWEQPADEGAVIDPTEAAEAGKAESENPSTATTKK